MRNIRLIVDSGASRTLISRQTLEIIGNQTKQSKYTQKMVTASGIVKAPVVIVDSFYCLGKRKENFEVIAYDLPRESKMEGLLGMDFLSSFDYSFSLRSGYITIAK